MTHDTERHASHTASHAPSHPAGPAPAHDPDAERDPDTARRASRAGLRREAAAQRGAPPTRGLRSDPAHAAEEARRDAMQESLKLAARRFHRYAEQVGPVFLDASPGPRLPADLQRLRELFAAARQDLIYLRVQLASLSEQSCALAAHELGILAGAVSRLMRYYDRATAWAKRQGSELALNPEHLKDQLEMMYERAGRPLVLAQLDDAPQEGSLAGAAMETLAWNVKAVEAGLRAVRAGAGTPAAAVELERIVPQLRAIGQALDAGLAPRQLGRIAPKLLALVLAIREERDARAALPAGTRAMLDTETARLHERGAR